MRLVLVILLLITGCDHLGLEPEEQVFETGILTVRENCFIPEGCGPRYKLWDQEFGSFMPLLGTIDSSHSQLIISVQGQVVPLPPEELYGYSGPRDGILVADYFVHSAIPVHDFLVPAAATHAQDTYGCVVYWNKTFGWSLGPAPEIWVRMTNTFSSDTPLPFVQFTFDGNTGALLEAVDNLNGQSPCA